MSTNLIPPEYANDVELVLTRASRMSSNIFVRVVSSVILFVAVMVFVKSPGSRALVVLPWHHAGLIAFAVVAAALTLVVLPSKYGIKQLMANNSEMSVNDVVRKHLHAASVSALFIEIAAIIALVITYLTGNMGYVIGYSVYGVAVEYIAMTRRSQTLRDSRVELDRFAAAKEEAA